MKKIGETVDDKQITFASPEALLEKLGIALGAISPFGLINNKDYKEELYVDQIVYHNKIVSLHPNRNTASLESSDAMFRKFLHPVENKIKVIDL